MRRISSAAFVGFFMLAVTVACAQAPAVPQTTQDDSEGSQVVAKIGDQAITVAELEEVIAGDLFKINQQMYEARSNGLKTLIFDRLVEKAAAEAGVSVDEYLKQQIDDKAGAPDEEEIARVMGQFRARLPEDDAEARKQVVGFLSRQQLQERHEQLSEELRAAGNVVVLLEPPRAEVVITEHSPSRGPADAPVTLVEFTDFQCPYCSRVQDTVSQVMERYDGKVRHVFMNLPLPMHREAELAAEAAMCAGDQGKFWELHDWMFGNQKDINREQVLTKVRELELEEAQFTTCLDEHKYAAAVNGDKQQANSVGITGTPGFVINGRIITGAQPPANFFEVIDDELRRAGVELPKVKAAEEAEAEAGKAEAAS